MTREDSYPRRTRRSQRHERAEQKTPSSRIATREALDVARYIADLTAQLEAMAGSAQLDLLAYFLGMARAESEMFVRTNAEAGEQAPPEREGQDSYEAEPIDDGANDDPGLLK